MPPPATVDYYDEEFNKNLQLAKNLIKQLKRKSDRAICTKWITKLCVMRSDDPLVKKNRNQFFKYMLTVLHKGVDETPIAPMGLPQYDDKHGGTGEDRGEGFMSRWSADRRTYVAVQPMPGKGALVYMAVSKDPKLGWDRSK